MKRKTVLVTAVDSFTGFFLQTVLRSRGLNVAGTSNRQTPGNIQLDITDGAAVKKCVTDVQPDYVINLAGVSYPARGSELLYKDVNARGAVNLAAACLGQRKRPRNCIFVSSATVYSGTKHLVPIDESAPIEPMNQYGSSKADMENALSQYKKDLPISICRPFNYTGPGQKKEFVIAKLVSSFKQKKTMIKLGNIDVFREFFDVRDVAERYADLLLLEEPFLTNLATGKCHSVREIILVLEELTGWNVRIELDDRFVRKNEPKYLCGSTRRLEKLVGSWPKRALEETLADMLRN